MFRVHKSDNACTYVYYGDEKYAVTPANAITLISPTASVVKNGTAAVITVTDITGTSTATVVSAGRDVEIVGEKLKFI